MYRYVLIVITILSVLLCVKTQSVTIKTNKGDVMGQTNEGYVTFFGVPFAKVDEDNPFGKSLEYPNFDTPFNANDSTIMCPQVTLKISGTIQCLTLNIYVPNTANANNKRPILVWFYGGGFVFGNAGYYGGQYLVQQDIVVVIVNYRLGPYGFLCLDNPNVPGNQGLKDQVTALQWVKENIDAFGGDNTKVTISGESYGGGSVDLHLYSLYDTLFDKAIVQSGSMYSQGLFTKGDRRAAIKIAKYLGHNVTRTKKALKLLAKEHPINVMMAAKNMSLSLTACKEKRFRGVKNFVDKDPYHLNNPERIKNTPIMIGYNSKETFDYFYNKTDEFYADLGNYFIDQLKKNFVFKDDEYKTIADIVKRFYLGSKEFGPESMLELIDFSSDYILNNAEERSVNKYIDNGGTVYKYLFSYVGGSEYEGVEGVGAIHTAELDYLFQLIKVLDTEGRMMRDRMTKMWASFVKFGNPTPEKTGLLPVKWEPVTGTTRPYMDIDLDMSLKYDVYQQRIAFWELFYHNYASKAIVFDKC